MNNNIAIIGAGKTGRGFVARLLNEAGLRFTFIDNVKTVFVSVGGTNISDGKLNILSENYPHLECDAKQLKNSFPSISQFEKVNNFENLLQRKIYTYNSASALIAYMGSSKGYLSYSEAANDPEIFSLLNNLYTEINKAVCLKFGYTFEDQKAFAQRLDSN